MDPDTERLIRRDIRARWAPIHTLLDLRRYGRWPRVDRPADLFR